MLGQRRTVLGVLEWFSDDFGWISDGFARSARDTDVVAIVRGWTPPKSKFFAVKVVLMQVLMTLMCLYELIMSC